MHRNLDCDIDSDLKKSGYYYNCSTIPLFDLGSLHHDYYLVNLRIPSAFDFDGLDLTPIENDKLGKLVDLWMISIHQNGGFTKGIFINHVEKFSNIFCQFLSNFE